jgi:3,4-dihydroxy 2-butanone 4-phosphate synthase/GTP cyclohydrolase II
MAGEVGDALDAVRGGRPVVVVDDGDAGRHAVLVVAAERATPENIAFTIRHTSGVVCGAMDGERLDQLDLPSMTPRPGAVRDFAVSVDARHGTTTGISAAERAVTLRALVDPQFGPDGFARPGHVFPLRAHPGGLFARPGHTEAALDLTALAGLSRGGALADLVDEGGELAPWPWVAAFADRFQLPVVTIRELLTYRAGEEAVVTPVGRSAVASPHGDLVVHVFRSKIGGITPLALVRGEVRGRHDVLVRIQTECLLGDVFGPAGCGCGDDLRSALGAVGAHSAGVMIYLRTPHAGLACLDAGADAVHDSDPSAGRSMDGQTHMVAASVLRALGIEGVRLLIDDPRAAAHLTRHGIRVDGTVPLRLAPALPLLAARLA